MLILHLQDYYRTRFSTTWSYNAEKGKSCVLPDKVLTSSSINNEKSFHTCQTNFCTIVAKIKNFTSKWSDEKKGVEGTIEVMEAKEKDDRSFLMLLLTKLNRMRDRKKILNQCHLLMSPVMRNDIDQSDHSKSICKEEKKKSPVKRSNKVGKTINNKNGTKSKKPSPKNQKFLSFWSV